MLDSGFERSIVAKLPMWLVISSGSGAEKVFGENLKKIFKILNFCP